jgi:hypothetical protein
MTNDWDTVQRIDRSDIVLDAMREQLYADLAPETYNAVGAAIQQRKIAKHLEVKSHTDRVLRASLAVAGYETRGWVKDAA